MNLFDSKSLKGFGKEIADSWWDPIYKCTNDESDFCEIDLSNQTNFIYILIYNLIYNFKVVNSDRHLWVEER